MAEAIVRSLRDGAFEGEHAPALAIEDSLRSPLGSHVFDHFFTTLTSHISAGKAQARALVLVAFARSPSYYFDLLRRRGLDEILVKQWVHILDCYSDPLGWKLAQDSESNPTGGNVSAFREVKNLNKLISSILHLGKGYDGHGKGRFAVGIDLVSSMLHHASLPSVAGVLNDLRSNDQVSCIFWLMHSDLHESRVSTALEYLSTMVATLEPTLQCFEGQRSSHNLRWNEENSCKAKFNVRIKRRNGRVKLVYEEAQVEQFGMKFATVSLEDTAVNKNLLPKVQFNLQLSDKERVDRANVILPFEHQGNGEPIQIYDGRYSSVGEGKKVSTLLHPRTLSSTGDISNISEKGEIHYVRDSDDERPDSDEDPDDDLDI